MWNLDNVIWMVLIAGGLIVLALIMGAVLYGVMARGFPITKAPAGKGAPAQAAAEKPAPEPPRPLDPKVEQAHRARRSAAYRQGIMTFAGLAVLTAAEFALAVWVGSLVLLLIVALAKAVLIVQYFMHLSRVWQEGAEEVLS